MEDYIYGQKWRASKLFICTETNENGMEHEENEQYCFKWGLGGFLAPTLLCEVLFTKLKLHVYY